MSKGSNRRPAEVSREDWEAAWDRTFPVEPVERRVPRQSADRVELVERDD